MPKNRFLILAGIITIGIFFFLLQHQRRAVLSAPGEERDPPQISSIEPLQKSALTAVWANNGEDKVSQDELRATRRIKTINNIWDGEKINLFGAQNEIVAFNVILEAENEDAQEVQVEFDHLAGPDDRVITSRHVDKDRVFDFVGRDIEIFYVRYLQIRGISRLSYDATYDERHVPERFRLPYSLPNGTSRGRFEDRPDAYKYYPDIAVPIEAVGKFDIKKGQNQSVWVDIYIPKDVPSGQYEGTVFIREADQVTWKIPVHLEVLPFALPDTSSAKTMVYYSEAHINDRYLGKKWPTIESEPSVVQQQYISVWKNHHKLAHRHKVSLVDDGKGINPERIGRDWLPLPMDLWMSVLAGDLFTAEHGYSGPGKDVSGGVYSIGTYGAWRWMWDPESKEAMRENTDRWVKWFEMSFPYVDYFLYLWDEPKADKFSEIERWAAWIDQNPGPGQRMKTLVTSPLPKLEQHMPSVDIGFAMWGDSAVWKPIVQQYQSQNKEYWSYNGQRPFTGSFAIEDDGVALRVLGWTQFKHKINRWFYWESTAYKNSSHTSVETNVFQSAWTFGRKWDKPHQKYGETGNGYNNGDGILFYPGTEKRYPEDNYGLAGPIASLRLKHWRRGIQDVDYLTMASQIDPQSVAELIEKMIPKVLWEVGVSDPKDPTYVHADISWSTDPNVWEDARRKLAEIIISGSKKDNAKEKDRDENSTSDK